MPFLKLLAQLIRKGVAIRLIHAKEPGPAFREDFDKYPSLINGMERALCPRVHFKMFVFDGKEVYVGSANLTGAGIGMKGENTRNFEAGILTDDPVIVQQAMNQFDKVWMGSHCKTSPGSRIKGHDGKPELQIIVSFNRPEDAVETYRQRWQIETMFKAMKSAGFNIEATHLTDIERIEKLLLIVMMAFVWCYNIGEFVHRNLKPIRILPHGRKAKSIFRYGLDILTEFLVRGRNDHQLQFFDFLIINEIRLDRAG